MRRPFILVLFLSGTFYGCSSNDKNEKADNKSLIPYTVAKAFPHDVNAFTQGLTVDRGILYESTGQENSWIAEVDIATGNQDKKVVLDKKYFGEGITILNNKVYQLTWQNKVGFIYDAKTFQKTGEFHYAYEGWGITHDGKNLIVSDGTYKLHFLDTITQKELSYLMVKDNGEEADELNELEYIDGYIYANQWESNYVLKIDPVTGNVVGKIDLSDLAEKARRINPRVDVLNGIAYEKKSKLLLVTGKYWPVLFALRFKTSETTAP